MRVWLLILPVLALVACGPYPRDISGTLDNIEKTRVLRVGLADLRQQDRAIAEVFIRRMERATGAKAVIDSGPAETQIARLENRRLDLVMGEFAEDSPWIAEVSILEPLSRRTVGQRTFGLSPVAENGENRWIGLIEREVRDEAAGSAK